MPTPASFDDLDGASFDDLYTYDDPMLNVQVDRAYARGTVLDVGPGATVAWTSGGDVVENAPTPWSYDDFVRSNAVYKVLNSNSDFEGGTTTGWVGANGAALANSTDWSAGGTRSLKITPDGVTGTPGVAQSALTPVRAGLWYGAKGYIVSQFSGNYGIGIAWYDASSVFITTSMVFESNSTSIGSFIPKYFDVQYQAPTGAAFASIVAHRQGTSAATDVFYVDDMQLWGYDTTTMGTWGTSFMGQPWTLGNTDVFSLMEGNGVAIPVAQNIVYVARQDGVVGIDFDVAAKVRVPQVMTGARGSVYLIARWVDSSNFLRVRFDWNTLPSNTISYLVQTVDAGVTTSYGIATSTPLIHDEFEGYYWVRAQGIGENVRLMVWKDGEAAPDAWAATVSIPAWAATSGSVGLGFLVSTGNTNSPPARFDTDIFISGVNQVLSINNISTGMSLDDGLPDGVTNTDNLGVSEAVAVLSSPVGTDPTLYWSTYRQDQPFSRIDRDTAGVAITSGVVADDGVRTSRLFTGQMADMPISGTEAKLKAVSRTRLRMSKSINIPAVNAGVEGCNATWAICFALWKAGLLLDKQWPTLPGLRYYLPANGSTRSYVPEANQPNTSVGFIEHTAVGVSQWVRPKWKPGMVTLAPDVGIGAERTVRMQSATGQVRLGPGRDLWSQAGNQGRIEFWMKADEMNIADSNKPDESRMVEVYLTDAGFQRYVVCGVTSTRKPFMWLRDGVNSTYVEAPPLPVDYDWHFIGLAWDLDGHTCTLRVDNDIPAFSTLAAFNSANLAPTDNYNNINITAVVPMVELRITSDVYAARSPWVNTLPYTPGVVMRPSEIELEGLAEKQPVEVFEFIQRFARGELAVTGFDENDRFLYLPMSYWGEIEQLTVRETLSTKTNLPKEFLPERQVTKTYNQVVVKFKEATVQQLNQKVYEGSQLITLQAGATTTITVPLEVPMVQIRDYGIAQPGASLVTPPTYNYTNYITANTQQDGLGTYGTIANLIAKVVDWGPGYITFTVQNTTSVTYWITNHLNLPSIGFGGRILQLTDASEMAEDDLSVARRGPRLLETSLDVLQSRNNALMVARELVARLSSPRTRFTTPVWPDARRKPGMLVTVSDADRSGLSGDFRVMGVTTTQNGATMSQQVSAVQSRPALVWGVGTWGETIWGEGS